MNSGIVYKERLSPNAIKPGDLYGGRYRLVNTLGKGGYGCVWKCEDIQENNKELAIKILPPNHANKISIQRFRDEIKIMKEHSQSGFIMPIYSASEIPNRGYKQRQIYYVMPIAEGDGKALLKSPIEAKIDAIDNIFLVLEYLHLHQIAHRDIKLQNILLYNGNFILSDYGLVTYPGKNQITRWREPVGPFENFDPRATFSREIPDHQRNQIDVYEFAKVIWTLLCGKRKISFHGQYNHCGIESLRRYLPSKYSCHKLEQLLTDCTSLDISKRPKVQVMRMRFKEWWEDNKNHSEQGDLLWQDLLYRIFPEHIPDSAFWTDEESIKKLLIIFIENRMCYKCSNNGFWRNIFPNVRSVRNVRGYTIQYINSMFIIKINNDITLTLKKKG